MNFWKTKPLHIKNNDKKECTQLFTNDILLNNIKNELDSSKIKVDYKVYKYDYEPDIDKIKYILQFINNNYITSLDNNFKLLYTIDLLKFYCINSLIIEFYPKNKKTVIGYIIGKREMINVYQKKFECLEVNFLCVVPTLRNIGLAPYMINILTYESLLNYNIGIAHYTIADPYVKIPHYSKKNFYHRLININKLVEIGFIHNGIDENAYMFDKRVNNNSIKCYNYKMITGNPKKLTHDLLTLVDILQLYDKYIDYCNITFDIYEHVSKKDFIETFYNDVFYHFVIKNDQQKVISYICMYKLDTIDIYKETYTNGYLYYMFFDTNIIDSLELTMEYIYLNGIFDVVTFSDIFKFQKYNKLIDGSGVLRYFMFNGGMNLIQNDKNALITI